MKMTKALGWIAMACVVALLAACGAAPGAKEPERERPAQEQPMEEQPTEEQPSEERPAGEAPAEAPAPEEASEERPAEEPPPEGAPPTAKEAATSVARALKAGDLKEVAKWAHPEKGVRFSPYAYVDVEKNLVFSREDMEGLMENETVHTWGTESGSGEEIELTYAEYHKRFVYDAAFLDDGEVAENRTLGKSTTTDNLAEVYPSESHEFIEYYIDGVDPAFEGMDWRSLRLVFAKLGGDRALVGIVHDQWTP